MKTNLDSAFLTDTNLETKGIWFEPKDGVRFLCRRFGGMNSQKVKSASSKYFKPFVKQIEIGALSEEKSREITVKTFVDSCLITWEGVVVDDQEFPFSFENAVTLLTKMPELTDALIRYASDMGQYKVDLGNF